MELLKLAGNYGVAGLLIFLLYRLVDKWAPQFLTAHQAQARAMGELANAVKEGREEQQHVVIALRALATQVRDLDEHIRAERAKGAVA